MKRVLGWGLVAGLVAFGGVAHAADTVRIGVNPVSASLPLYVGMDKGYFAEQGLTLEPTQMIGGPPNVAAMISNQIDVSINLTSIDAANANLKKPGVALFIALNAQSKTYQMEQFMVRKGLDVKSLADLKGKKIMTFPGPANVAMARTALRANGLKDGDYQLDQLDLGQHINALTAGTFDAAYTLEPAGAVMRKSGVATTIESGIIGHYVLGDPNANGWAAGTATTTDYATAHPDVLKKFAAAWAKSIDFINRNPDEARKALVKNTLTPADVADTVPFVKWVMVSDLSTKDMADFQKFIDFCVDNKILSDKVDVSKMVWKP